MQKVFLLTLALLGCQYLVAQDYPHQIELLKTELAELKAQQAAVELKIEDVKLARIRQELKEIGLPSTEYIEHQAMMLAYSEEHEQARWVAHIITPDIIDGALSRSNDFRADPLVTTGTAVQADYFLTDTLANGKVNYDGFGYDRGHLAPSADFRWCARAMSESYYYSNMSPQLADFNREGWADLEAHLRGYIYKNPETQLYVVTGPVLEEGLPVVARSPNEVAIPKTFFKVALDLQAGQAIGFLMPNAKATHPLEHYAVPVDQVEALTGLDFFSQLPNAEAIESGLEKAHWFEAIAQGDVEPIYPPSLPRNHFNTIQARDHINSGRAVTICGKVVSARYSRSGNVWLNLDKRYPNDICSVMIRKEDLVNFSGDPIELFEGKVVAAKGKVFALGGKPVVGVKRGEDLQEMGEGV